MPKQNKKSSHRVPFYRRPITILLCLVAVIVIALVVILLVKAIKGNDDTADNSTDEPENVIEYAETDEFDDLAPEDQKVIVQYEGENPNELDHLTGIITYAEIADNTLSSMVSIDQYLGSGTCTARLKSGEQIILTVEKDIEADASTSHCGPITMNLSGIGGGRYSLEVEISGGGKTGIVTSKVEI